MRRLAPHDAGRGAASPRCRAFLFTGKPHSTALHANSKNNLKIFHLGLAHVNHVTLSLQHQTAKAQHSLTKFCTMKNLNNAYPATQVVNALTINNDEMVGAIVEFKKPECGAQKGLFEVVGCQRVWGYNNDGKYTMIDGYRVMPVQNSDGFGLPTSMANLKVITGNQ